MFEMPIKPSASILRILEFEISSNETSCPERASHRHSAECSRFAGDVLSDPCANSMISYGGLPPVLDLYVLVPNLLVTLRLSRAFHGTQLARVREKKIGRGNCKLSTDIHYDSNRGSDCLAHSSLSYLA